MWAEWWDDLTIWSGTRKKYLGVVQERGDILRDGSGVGLWVGDGDGGGGWVGRGREGPYHTGQCGCGCAGQDGMVFGPRWNRPQLWRGIGGQ